MSKALLVGAAVALVLVGAPSARALDWEGEVAAGPAFSNAGVTSLGLHARVGLSLGYLSLSLLALDIPGAAATDGRTQAYAGWLALGELRGHTGHLLGPVRLHLALGGGLGREISGSPGLFPDGGAGPVETGRTGPALLVSTGASAKAGEIAFSADLSSFYWTRVSSAPGPVANGGLGFALLFGVGVIP